MHLQSLSHSLILIGCSGLCMWISVSIRKYLESHPGKSRPANGKSPLFLGTGNGIGIRLCGDFPRQPIDGRPVSVQYAFICFLLPLIPIGCYNASMTSISRKTHKETTTSYAISGTQPWRFLEVLQIYLWWPAYAGIALGVIGAIASLFGENFI